MHKIFGLSLLFLLAPAGAQAANGTAAELLAGCASCHGAQGQGNQALGAPPLAGQDAAYLARQLSNFKSGRRGYAGQDASGQAMRAQAAGLDEQQIASLAQHYAGLPAVLLAAAAELPDPLGAARYLDTCAACHGVQAQGYPQMQAPNLRLLGGWYIDQQLASYIRGWRGAEAHADIQGMWMRSIATHVGSGADLAALIGYIQTLGSQ
ncbi:cytochrome c4 [Pseudomonas sp. N040]|uniref:cytochrome c4 n=1 Tax=Pseudomonas sp. N040 TaxID=2785325 RepID=UPI0018A2EB90|nr:c-type cytochrome [Pseudomonas sp. N040]MBF7729804.1 c-type cytochrome [Pseudomonas sp. N040]MBW7013446.1 cytochrome c [Pseudomonas sp. N040]